MYTVHNMYACILNLSAVRTRIWALAVSSLTNVFLLECFRIVCIRTAKNNKFLFENTQFICVYGCLPP